MFGARCQHRRARHAPEAAPHQPGLMSRASPCPPGRDWVAHLDDEGLQAWRVRQAACGLNHSAAVIELQPEAAALL